MKLFDMISQPQTSQQKLIYHKQKQALALDYPLLYLLLLLAGVGLFVLYSASNQNLVLVKAQFIRLSLAFLCLILFAFISPQQYQRSAPWAYCAGVLLLSIVLLIGHIGKGAQRWLDLGVIRFQPAEILKLALPMMLAWYFNGQKLPPSLKSIFIAIIIILVPMLLTAKQPDLGTALLIGSAGFFVLFLAGMPWQFIMGIATIMVTSTPVLWYFMRDYQRARVLTFLNPERDPLGNGYHIIQSKIAIGSGGLFGKGWLNGTQAHLAFLPEHSTDFIFAVIGEEFGLIGCAILLLLYLAITARCLYISTQAQDTFTRLLAGSLSMMFFISLFVNIGMVSGILPVVGIPLPLVSYGGTSIVTLLASFGIIMSIQANRKLLPR